LGGAEPATVVAAAAPGRRVHPGDGSGIGTAVRLKRHSQVQEGTSRVLLLYLYRLLPGAFRLWLRTVVPTHWQLRLTRRILRFPYRRTRGARSARPVRDGGRRVRARVSDDATPRSVRRDNLSLVARALEADGVPFFCLPRDTLRSAVAVPIHSRRTVLRRLERLRRSAVDAPPVVAILPGGRSQDEGSTVSVHTPVTDAAGSWVLGSQCACEIEFWHEEGRWLVGPRRRRSGLVLRTDDVVVVPEHELSPHLPRFSSPATTDPVPTRMTFVQPRADRITFPIDAVFTWVDGSDPDWYRRKTAALAAYGATDLNHTAADMARYANRDELRYALRSLLYFAPWIRNIYLVTDDQAPPWLDLTHPMITVVRHREIFGASGVLPTFNSHAIESRLHHIPGLAEHFIYFNDDMFLGRPVRPQKFFHANGIAKFFISRAELDPSPPSLLDLPVTAAGKNNRRHIRERFGRTITQKMRHVPYPLRVSVLEEIEATLSTEVAATASHQFRHPADLSIPSSLAHYWAFLTGRAVAGSIRFLYADLAAPVTPFKLNRLLATRSFDGFCLNDDQCDRLTAIEQRAMLGDFLPAYFPFRAPFELSDEVTAHRATFSATELMNGLGSVPASREADAAPEVRVTS
jgi:hypothetical protein